jgi:hypothetical protein
VARRDVDVVVFVPSTPEVGSAPAECVDLLLDQLDLLLQRADLLGGRLSSSGAGSTGVTGSTNSSW